MIRFDILFFFFEWVGSTTQSTTREVPPRSRIIDPMENSMASSSKLKHVTNQDNFYSDQTSARGHPDKKVVIVREIYPPNMAEASRLRSYNE